MTDIVVQTLKKKFFELAAREDYPKTPDITSQLDALQKEIRFREARDIKK